METARAIGFAFGAGRKLRAFHAHVSALPVHLDAELHAGVVHLFRQAEADRVAEPDVRDDALAEKGVDAVAGAIEELIDDHDVARLELFLEAAAGADANHVRDAEHLQRTNVGAVRHFGRREAMAPAVARQKHHRHALHLAGHQLVGRRTERRVDRYFLDLVESFHRI